jgi:hypothetical protein
MTPGPARRALAEDGPVCLSWQRHRPMGVPVLHELDYDDSDSPSIGLVPPGVTWEDVYDHIKIAHHPLLVVLDDGTDHVGAYWDGTKMIVAEDLGPDQDEAVAEFRELLRERGEH